MPAHDSLSHFDLCRASTIAYIFWEIWVACCASYFEGRDMRARRICQRIIAQVKFLSVPFRSKKASTLMQNHILGIIGVQRKMVISKRGRWFQWTRPISSFLKLNIDGSAKDGLISGGDIIRNEEENLIVAFYSFYGSGMNSIV